MFKLNQSGGKFDIIFTGDPLDKNETSKKKNNASNARLRTQKEYKSTILKTKQNTNNKNSKTNDHTKQGCKQSKTQNLKSTSPKSVSNVQQTSTNKKSTSEIPRLIYQKKKAQTKQTVPAAVSKHQSNAESTKKELSGPMDSPKKSNESSNRPRTYVFKKTNNGRVPTDNTETAGILSQGELDDIFRKFYKDDAENKETYEYDSAGMSQQFKSSSNFIEPLYVQGLSDNKVTEKGQLSESSNDIILNTLDSSREDKIRKKQSSPNEEYNPWGKPGAGAPVKEGTGNIRSAIRNYKEVKFEKRLSPSLVEKNQASQHSVEGNGSYFVANTKSTSYARGQVKTQQEFDELELKRKKHLEHQEAIKAQVEEKRRIKQLEKEKEKQEDNLAAERFLKQQEVLNARLEEVARLQKETEAIKKAQQDALAENLRQVSKVKLAANQKEKLDGTTVIKQKKNYTPKKETVKPTETDAHYHHSEELVKSNLLGTYTLDKLTSGFKEFNGKIPHVETKKERKQKSKYEAPTKKTTPRLTGDEYQAATMNDYLDSNRVNIFINEKPDNTRYEHYPHEGESTTTQLRYSSGDQRRKQIDRLHSEGSIRTEYFPSPINSPTSRQQLILEQLNNLRQGLMRKQQEYL